MRNRRDTVSECPREGSRILRQSSRHRRSVAQTDSPEGEPEAGSGVRSAAGFGR